MTEAIFKIGDKVQDPDDITAQGVITAVTKWNNPDGYQGYVYEFKNGYGRVFFGYKESELSRVQ